MQGLRNLADLVRRNASDASAGRSRPALVWQDRTITWTELDAQVDAYARGLIALRLPASTGHPARVAIACANRPEFVALYFAILRAGLVAVPVNPGYTARELGQLLADAGVSVLIGTPEVLGAVATVAGDLPARTFTYQVGVVVDSGVKPLADLARDGAPIEPTAGGEDLAVLLYTSGTEGRPKGAMLSHRALLANQTQLAAIEPAPIEASDTVLLTVPLFHAYGLNSGLGAVAFHGACGVLIEHFDPVETLRLIDAHRITVVIGVPTMFIAWSLLPDFGEAFASVRVAVCGAASLAAGTAERFLAATGHPILMGYGLTETAPVLTTSLASPVPKVGSIGRPIPGVEIRLVSAGGDEVWRGGGAVPHVEIDDFDDDASGSPGTDPGEIVARGDNLFSGYWPDGADGAGTGGWWATGDIAYADADGDLFLVDRLRELIIVNGFNVYPLEIEQVLLAYPAVVDAAVLGVPHPYTGQSVKAYVVTSEPVGVDELIAHCERNLARFKCPTAIEFAASLPHSVTGKVRKAALRDGSDV